MVPHFEKRDGFTLPEVLVVIAIVATLIALAVPAIQKTREAGSRARCASNLRNLALATHAYHEVFGYLPVNTLPGPVGPYDSNHNSWSWLARILPYVDQAVLYSQCGMPDATLYDSRAAVAQQVRCFLCPSDAASSRGPRTDDSNLGWLTPSIAAGQTNYKGVSGSNWGWGDPQWQHLGVNGSWDGVNEGDGIFYRCDWKARKQLTDITDGTSNTFMIGEDLPAKNYWCSWPHANSACGTCAIAPNAKMFDGQEYPARDWMNVYSFRSNHPGGLQFANADGSVHFITNAIDLGLYRALATINGGELAATP